MWDHDDPISHDLHMNGDFIILLPHLPWIPLPLLQLLLLWLAWWRHTIDVTLYSCINSRLDGFSWNLVRSLGHWCPVILFYIFFRLCSQSDGLSSSWRGMMILPVIVCSCVIMPSPLVSVRGIWCNENLWNFSCVPKSTLVYCFNCEKRDEKYMMCLLHRKNHRMSRKPSSWWTQSSDIVSA